MGVKNIFFIKNIKTIHLKRINQIDGFLVRFYELFITTFHHVSLELLLSFFFRLYNKYDINYADQFFFYHNCFFSYRRFKRLANC